METDSTNIDQVLISLRQIIRAIDLHSKKLIQKYGLSVPQILVLKEVVKKDIPTVGYIAKAVNLSQGTVTQIIIRLEERGYIFRQRDDSDRRKVLVESTASGREILEKAPPLLHENFIAKFSSLKDWEQNMTISSLQRVAEMMGAEHMEAAPILSSGTTLTPDPVPDLPNDEKIRTR
ncbi:MAG: MarR family transcriptional regulator [Candidatus Electryonea clarkiae]|nr:MarR family transcriptional regulator [Candidatus Electryonea clarkiae]MDP8287666.1 MarR family transcriptional regulator [Candidatus Electryonea clarkiae]